MKKFAIPVLVLLTGAGMIYVHSVQVIRETVERQVAENIHMTRYDTIIYRDTVCIPIPTYVQHKMDSTVNISRSDIASVDSDSIGVKSVTRVYADSTFRAVVSGISPSLDSLTVYPKIRTITQTVTCSKPKIPRWSIGVTAGTTFSPQGLSPGVTVGLSYRLWP